MAALRMISRNTSTAIRYGDKPGDTMALEPGTGRELKKQGDRFEVEPWDPGGSGDVITILGPLAGEAAKADLSTTVADALREQPPSKAGMVRVQIDDVDSLHVGPLLDLCDSLEREGLHLELELR